MKIELTKADFRTRHIKDLLIERQELMEIRDDFLGIEKPLIYANQIAQITKKITSNKEAVHRLSTGQTDAWDR